MSIVLRHSFLVRDFSAVTFYTEHGIDFHYFSRNSVYQKVPIVGSKRFFYPQVVPFKPSKPSQTKLNPVQAPCTIKTVQPENQEGELLDGSIKVGADPSQTKQDDLVHEKPFLAPSKIKTVPPQNSKQERFASSVTMGAAPSPRHVPVPMFCIRQRERRLIKESLKQTT